MDKRIIIVILLIIIAILVAIIFNRFTDQETLTTTFNTNVPINPQPEQEQKVVEVTPDMYDSIEEGSFLYALVQIRTFDKLNVNYESLLEAAMRIAGKSGLFKEPEEGEYFEYVPRDVVHEIIYELSGIRIPDPIIVEDFYYVYSEEGDYYKVIPIGSNWLELKKVNSIHYSKDGDQYIIKCMASSSSEDYGDVETFPNMEIRLKYKPANKYIKYQLQSVVAGKQEEA